MAAIPGDAATQSVSFTLPNGLGVYKVEVIDDVGTMRIKHSYNGAFVRYVTPAGGHVEDKPTDIAHTPANYQIFEQA